MTAIFMALRGLATPTLLFASAIFVLGLGPAIALPVPVGPATWESGGFAYVTYSGVTKTLSGTVAAGTTTAAAPGGFAEIQVTIAPVPSITAIASGYNPAALSNEQAAFAQGIFTYFGIIDTPGGSVSPTTVNVVAGGSLFSMPDTPAFSSFDGSHSLARLNVNGVVLINAASDRGDNNGALSAAAAVPVKTNQVFGIKLEVRSWTFEPSVSATTFLDPFFFLDPIQIDQGWTLRFSDGFGNSLPSSSEVPVPAALPLFATGLGALGLLGWRKRRATASLGRR